MFHICSNAAAPREKAECPVPSKPFRLPRLASERSGRSGGRARRKPGRKSRSSVSRAAALRPPALRCRRAWRQSRLAGKRRRKGLKWFNSRREMVWPRRLGPPISGAGPAASVARRITAASRRSTKLPLRSQRRRSSGRRAGGDGNAGCEARVSRFRFLPSKRTARSRNRQPASEVTHGGCDRQDEENTEPIVNRDGVEQFDQQ